MRYLIAFLLAMLMVSTAAQARCITNDPWTGPDKVKHLGVGFAVGSSVTLATKRPIVGLLSGAGVGIAKEVYDSRRPGHVCSIQDAIVTAAGAAAGAYGTAWVILPQRKGVQVAFAKAF